MTDLEALYRLQNEPGAKDAGFLWRAALAQRIEVGHAHVVNVNGQPAGYVIASPRRDGILHLPQVVITEELWRSGLGSALMKSIIAAPWPQHIDSLTLKCAVDAAAAQFWPAVGLTPVAEVEGQRRRLTAWSTPIGPEGRIRLAPVRRRPRRLYEERG